MRLDDGNVASFIRCGYPIDNIVSAFRKLNECGSTLCDDMIVGHDVAILAYKEAGALGNSVTILVRHNDRYDGPIRSFSYRWYVLSRRYPLGGSNTGNDKKQRKQF